MNTWQIHLQSSLLHHVHHYLYTTQWSLRQPESVLTPQLCFLKLFFPIFVLAKAIRHVKWQTVWKWTFRGTIRERSITAIREVITIIYDSKAYQLQRKGYRPDIKADLRLVNCVTRLTSKGFARHTPGKYILVDFFAEILWDHFYLVCLLYSA